MVGKGGAPRGKITLYFRSGSFKDEPQEFIDKLVAAFQGSVEEGTQTFLAQIIGTVARKTGKLRQWFRRMIASQADVVGDVYRITLKFKAPPNDPNYFIYHIPALAPKTRFRVGQPYKQPTTPGTKPISIKEVLLKWSRAIERAMLRKFSQLGVAVSTAVKAGWYKH